MRVLVTGGAGQLGSEIRVASKNSPNEFIFTDISTSEGISTLDITDNSDVTEFLEDNKIDIIINCAAYTSVDEAEEKVELAKKLNFEAAEILAKCCAKRNITLIHISTDYVFDGKANIPYKETSQTCPSTVYGITKLDGERIIEESGCKYIIIRTAWLYGAFGKNFVKTILSLLNSKPSLKVVNDQFGSPTYAGDLAMSLVKIIERGCHNKTGLYHFTNMGICTWYEFAMEIKELSGSKTLVYPCTSEEFPTKAERPKYSVLDKAKFISTFGLEIPHWKDSLEKFLSKYNLGK